MEQEEKIRDTWDKLKLHPGRLTKLVGEGKAKLLGKDEFGRWIYEISTKTLEEERRR